VKKNEEMKKEVNDLVREYKKTGDSFLIGEIIKKMEFGIRHLLVTHFSKVLSKEELYSEIDDFVSIAKIEVIKCLDRFDVERNSSFYSFTTRRIVGSVMDERQKEWRQYNFAAYDREIISSYNYTPVKKLKDYQDTAECKYHAESKSADAIFDRVSQNIDVERYYKKVYQALSLKESIVFDLKFKLHLTDLEIGAILYTQKQLMPLQIRSVEKRARQIFNEVFTNETDA
jgi:DNA-directed RNA polymerase specialized sigma subunit